MVISDTLSGVRYQDVGVLVAVIAAVFIFRAPDVYELKPVWRLDITDNHNQDDNVLPLPIITDLDSDGINELIVATSHGTIKVMTFPSHDSSAHSVLPHLHTKAESSIREEKDSSDQRVIVAMATGCFQTKTKSKGCFESVAVVASDWSMYVYNHYLKLLWKTTISDQAYKTLNFREIAALVIPHSEDGLIIVGGRVATNSHHKQTFSHNHHINNTIPKQTIEELARKGNVQTNMDANKVSSEDHFSTFAFSGLKGHLVWNHKPGDFEANQTAREKLLSSYHFKLALQPNQHHIGEEHWSKYQKSLLHVMPYRWHHPSDTSFTTSYFGKGSKGLHSQENKDNFNIFSSYTVDNKKSINHNAVVIHNQHGIEVLQLDTGRPLCRYPVTKHGVTIGDVNGDDVIDQVMSHGDTMDHGPSCTAVVLSEGHRILFQGPICQTLSVFGGIFDSTDDADHGEEQFPVPPVVVESPPHRSGIVRHLMGHNLKTDRGGLDSVFLVSTGKVTSFGPHGELNWQVKVDGEWKHHVQSLAESTVKYFPSMKPVSIKTGQEDQNALFISSWLHISLVALVDGTLLASHTLPCQPVSPVVQGDFTNDGLTDFVIHCSDSYLGFALERRIGYTWTIIWLVSGLSVLGVALALMRCFEEVIL